MTVQLRVGAQSGRCATEAGSLRSGWSWVWVAAGLLTCTILSELFSSLGPRFSTL